MEDQPLPICVAALYRFAPMANLPELRGHLLEQCQAQGIKGTLLIAPEGINGTIAGSDAGVAAVIKALRGLPGCAELDIKYSRTPDLPFQRMKVRIKREIVTMGQPHIDPLETGHYVTPQDWNALIADPDLVARMADGRAERSRCNSCNKCVAEMDRGGVRCVLA